MQPRLTRRLLPALAAVVLALAGCAAPSGGAPGARPAAAGAEPRAAPPSLGLFSRIRAPENQEPVLRLAARGVQIFRCEPADGGRHAWRFRQPEAELTDASGAVVARHGADFSFEHRDGSRLLGTVLAHDRPASADDLPWLLLATRSFGNGAFAGITYAQRIDTRGGMPPPACGGELAGRLLRVDFSADFVFYRPHP